MGHSQLEKAQTHARIVRIASERLREKGLEGISIADLMKEAGLTVGGFYKHFESRDDLVAEAIESTLGSWQTKIEAAAVAGQRPTFRDLAENYLSLAHRDAPGQGCVISALVCDIARSGDKSRELLTKQIRNNIELISGFLEKKTGSTEAAGSTRAEAILAISAMVGALSLSRAVSDDALSREILTSVARLLTDPVSEGPSCLKEDGIERSE
jgi:TetR/AcrR family transcriptional regulator, transcriptional repressor for nem operon